MNPESDDPIRVIDEALASVDEAWPTAEAVLWSARERGVPVEVAASHGDPVGRQMAATAADMDAAGRAALEQASEYLDGAAQYFARTAAGIPPVDGVLANLTATWGPTLARPLSLRLAQRSDLPNWRVVTILAYLDRHRDPVVVPSLVRFAARTEVPSQQEFAVRILASMQGPAIASSIREERARWPTGGREFPVALANLAPAAA